MHKSPTTYCSCSNSSAAIPHRIMAVILISRNAHVCSKLMTRTMTNTTAWNASGSESKKQYGNQLFHSFSYSTAMVADSRMTRASKTVIGAIEISHQFALLSLVCRKVFSVGTYLSPSTSADQRAKSATNVGGVGPIFLATRQTFK